MQSFFNILVLNIVLGKSKKETLNSAKDARSVFVLEKYSCIQPTANAYKYVPKAQKSYNYPGRRLSFIEMTHNSF